MKTIEHDASPEAKNTVKRPGRRPPVASRDLLTKQEAGDEMGGLSVSFINGLIASRKLEIVRLGHRTVRIPRKAVADYIEKHTLAGKQ